ncbi:regulatory protein RecX [Flavobacterium cyanobacteriorum]|nr:regulatory protein RecX [Flavobacterium cyanobacteriorum]
MINKYYTVEEAKQKLEYYCSYQERCHEEVLQKLKGLNMIPEAIDVIMNHLIENNYLNEERFARSFARGRYRIKNWGRIRITNELKARGISKYNIIAAMAEIDPDEYQAAFDALADKIWKSTAGADSAAKKRKVADYLLRKGFESNLVYDKINSLCR